MYTLQQLLFSASLAVYVATSIFFAAVRWGHKCEQYAKHMDYYYPAWRVLVACYLSNIIMAPAIFLPASEDAILQLRMLLILASPFFCSVLLFSYFGKIQKNERWRRPIYVLSIPFAVVAVIATVLVFIPGTQLQGVFCRVFFAVGGTLGLVYLLCFIMALRMIVQELRRSMEEEYSNPNDFPQRFASGIMWIPLVHLAVSWITTYIGTPVAMSIGLLALSGISIALLIGVLSPHRAIEVDQLEKMLEPSKTPSPEITSEAAPEAVSEASSVAEESAESLSEERKDEIAKAIRYVVEEKQGYQDQHLTLTDLAHKVGYNRTYVSAVLKERLGGFFVYVNRCRLAHAARLRAEQPGISVSELIDASGFSRTTYYKIRRQLEENK